MKSKNFFIIILFFNFTLFLCGQVDDKEDNRNISLSSWTSSFLSQLKFEDLLGTRDSINALDPMGRSLLATVIDNDNEAVDLDLVALFIKRGADVNIGMPLYLSIFHNQIEVVRLLLEGGADVNAIDDTGVTPLHLAAYHGRLKIAQLLLERGARINERDNNNKTPLIWAIENNQLEVTQLLIEAGANHFVTENKYLLDVAHEVQSIEEIQQLLRSI